MIAQKQCMNSRTNSLNGKLSLCSHLENIYYIELRVDLGFHVPLV